MTTATTVTAMYPEPAAPADPPKMCLLHGDFHVMGQDCWSATFDFYFANQRLAEQQARDAYLAAVEQKMLNDLVRKHLASVQAS